ncbi:Zinc finger protein ZAT3 [Morus notabilis]|uniref:Zinc finger protein ZAT3 n=1 Tax=Morus notabilis TaxID=981085 RepID=W9SMY3_9ROSA|nr:uncharacterized protein LOC21405936 [Morus notabilis]EXC17809.1 Zinc finger protein ZAT3 [Morus notabilis]
MKKNGDAPTNKSPTKKQAPTTQPRRDESENSNVAAIGGPSLIINRQSAPTSSPFLPLSLRAQGATTGGGAPGIGSGVIASTAVAGGGIQVESTSEVPPSGSRPLKRKSEVSAPEGVVPTCSVCSKVFASWKALFGHMRSHPERQWRGCFPPPVAQQQLSRAGDHQAAFAESGGGNTQRREELDIDLNRPQEGNFGAPTDQTKNDDGGFDLNMPPMPDDDDDAS